MWFLLLCTNNYNQCFFFNRFFTKNASDTGNQCVVHQWCQCSGPGISRRWLGTTSLIGGGIVFVTSNSVSVLICKKKKPGQILNEMIFGDTFYRNLFLFPLRCCPHPHFYHNNPNVIPRFPRNSIYTAVQSLVQNTYMQ